MRILTNLSEKKGFTLLEVMVALALIGILFMGSSGVFQRQVRTQIHLEESLAASQLAWNLLELFHLEERPLSPDTVEGEGVMAGQIFPWTRWVIAEESGWYQVKIVVGTVDNPLYVERWYWLVP